MTSYTLPYPITGKGVGKGIWFNLLAYQCATILVRFIPKGA